MSENELFSVPETWAARAWTDNDGYLEMYRHSTEDPEGFWAEHAKRIDWIKPYSQIKDVSFERGDLHIRWFYDGTLNASANCLDRHLETRGDQVAIIWEGDEPGEDSKLTYRELHEAVCRFANGLKSLGAAKGDRITSSRNCSTTVVLPMPGSPATHNSRLCPAKAFCKPSCSSACSFFRPTIWRSIARVTGLVFVAPMMARKSARTSSISWYRSSGSFANALPTTCCSPRSPPSCRSGIASGSSFIIA